MVCKGRRDTQTEACAT